MTSDKLDIVVLPGDGIGMEVTKAALPVFEVLKIPVKLHFADIGWSFWQEEGTALPERTWQLIQKADAVLLGAVTSKPQREAQQELAKQLQKKNLQYVSPILQLRQKLDLYANLRPCFSLQEDKSFHFCIVRENTEGLYAGLDYYPLPEELHRFILKEKAWKDIAKNELSCSLRLQTYEGLSRIFQFAFRYADKHHMPRVTLADKPNVLRYSSVFARELFETEAHQYPHIKADILNVDAVALWLVRRPEEFGVIVAENMFADILSDVGAAVMGGLGFAPSANLGEKYCYFEPVHGSAPRLKTNQANPAAMFLTIGLMLEHLGFSEEAERIKTSVKMVVKERRFLTYDQGGHASTQDMAEAIMDKCRYSHQGNQEMGQCEKWRQLLAFSSTEISDALDSCGVEGALSGIKPLTGNTKLVGPAYTIKYAPYKKNTQTFKGAANYIDEVPAHSVIVIDNEGREDCTVWGDILTQTALQRGISGTVVHGAIRDVELIRQYRYPVYCKNYTMRSGKNRVHKSAAQVPVVINNVKIHPGDIIFADDNGVLVIPVQLIDEIIDKAKNIQQTEQKIVEAVKAGSSLKQARKEYGYDKPWLSQGKKE
ncbi:isocitrate/isopropylmalate family dehydrogenase [Legionella israelensis]|uniref:DlpA protein (Isocitrate and isopropylmalate dehydrogenase family protein) n=2 Tax=Legionella israelensis TaxID=454 RepID=A0A0W0V6Y6_9GAMM|nr:isocitrate/isopropylmalate family dehydrogenase [Legionella israelensis]KTD15872.1 DlpA protein (isocitrate and isopropylmalate dehydrogenase family protein) [Legionella israelensis]SCY22679.1 Isocitrate/isopropylmalate dehydrogenase [Legionella israelensis DSM 19235]STX58920.1 DlpA protein [Legionella israelensis]